MEISLKKMIQESSNRQFLFSLELDCKYQLSDKLIRACSWSSAFFATL